MRKKWLGYLFAGIGFFSLTFIMTYPLGLEMGSAINDTEDSLLNTWILSWDVNQIKTFNFSHFFDANFFFPHKKVLAYSEHLFSLSLIALPVKLLFNNPILAYNFTLLFAFFMCGFGMYLLAYHVTGDHWASFAGGIIYAFAPYKFAHLCHLQVVSAWAIPFSFLYLQKYFANYRFRYLLLLTFFFLFQVLGNGYFALYLTLFLGFAILYTIVVEKRYHDRKLMVQLIFFILVVLLVSAPFFYPYFVVRREMNFMRNELFWADISSYLASGPLNFLYGKITSPFLRPEGELFPGLIAVFLGYVGLRSVSVLKTGDVGQKVKSRDFKRLNRFLNILILFFLLISITIVITGGIQGTLWGIPFSAKTPRGFILYILIVVLIRLIYDRDFRSRVRRKLLGIHDTNLRIYFWMGMLSFLFTLGPEIHFFNIEIFPFGPYELLKIIIPGFDGLRVSSRFIIFVLFSFAVFSSIGFKVLKNRFMHNRFKPVIALVPLLLLTEYLSIPTPLFPVQVNNQIPNVYQWLGKQKKDFSIIELPLPKPWIDMARIEAPRVYFSSYHWKKLFN
ncbi:MAG: hypothetical protein MUQ20_00390, partial [Deltaproteobacteria bacterium]|nr:hypothetical protein [Deltaproteobacteria bacterium]